jgi:hypothetical protein
MIASGFHTLRKKGSPAFQKSLGVAKRILERFFRLQEPSRFLRPEKPMKNPQGLQI